MKSLVFLILLLLTSCTTTKLVEVPVEVEKTKIEYRDKLVHDSIYVRDSIDTHTSNDTVYKCTYKYIYKDKILRDTIVQRDSIPNVVRVETVKEVNRLKNWQIVLMILGGLFILSLLNKLRRII